MLKYSKIKWDIKLKTYIDKFDFLKTHTFIFDFSLNKAYFMYFSYYICDKCNLKLVINDNGYYPYYEAHSVTNINLLTCNEMIIKNIIE